MKLTQKQERRIAVFLRAAEQQLGGVPARARNQILSRLKVRIGSELKPFTHPPKDVDIERILADCASVAGAKGRPGKARREEPSARAPEPPKPVVARKAPEAVAATSAPAVLEPSDRRWLGVCSAVSERFGVDVRIVRAGMLALGLLTGPVAVIVYVAAYFEMYFVSGLREPPIEMVRLIRFPLGILLGAAAMFAGAKAFVGLVLYLASRFMARDVVALGPWGRVDAEAPALFFTAVLFLAPLAVLGSLPVANGWDATLRKVTQALLAVYALGVCCGVAGVLAGVLLEVVGAFTGR